MDTNELFDGFEELTDAPADVRDHHREHARETRDQWGETGAYKESMRRAKQYSKEDWAAIKEENRGNEARMASLLRTGSDPEGEEAMDGAEAMRRHIDRWYYPCGPGMHAGLADMYEADPRFNEYYEKVQPGLAAFVAAAIRANAKRVEKKSV